MSRTGRPRSNIWPLVIEDYKGGMSVSSIAEKHNLSVWGIKKALKREGIFIPKPVGGQKGQTAWNKTFDPVQGRQLYEAGKSTAQIAEISGVSQSAVSKAFLRSGYVQKEQKPYFTCSVDDAAFDFVTDEVAYWLGVLITDGCVCYPSRGGDPKISLQISSKDIDLVFKFKTFLKSTYPIYEFKRTDNNKTYVSCTVCSLPLAKTLEQYNIVPRKTQTAKAPSFLVANPHFWRGVVDGDGWVCAGNTKTIGVCGTEAICTQFLEFCNTVVAINTKASVRKESNNCWTVQIGGVYKLAKLAAYLYKDAPVYLNRKYALATKLF